MYSVSCSIKLKSQSEDIWKVISSHGNLNFFHPFCKKNKVIDFDKKLIKKDMLIYLNGVVFERHFYKWQEMVGYELMIGKKNGKKSKVVWKISEKKHYSLLNIDVYPYKTGKINSLLYPFVFFFYIKPMLKTYLSSVLKGLKFYLYNNKNVVKNQFGKHRWFS
tara:strand:+ start:1216 stop:1704 length:489 start_codon:yes stop_codon:yes gene_type:complete